MILDQLFEDDKKKLNEIDPRNYDSDVDYYNDRDAEDPEDDDVDPPDDDDYDPPNDEESYYEKSLRSRGLGESRLNEARLMEDPVYRNFKHVGQYIAERRMSEKEILQVFADAEAGMTDKGTGANRTMLGRGKDTTMDFAGGVADALKGVWGGIQNSVPVAAVDVAYDQATDALANLTGGQKGAIMSAIKKYRMLAKQYPKTAGLSKAALVAIAGLATGGAGLPAVAALVYGLDSSIKGDKLSDIALKAGGAAATAWAAGKLFGGPADPTVPADEIAALTDPVGGGTYTVMKGDQLGYIAQANGVSVEDIRAMNPQIDFAKPLQPGMELQLPTAGTPGQGSVWQGYQGNMYGDKVPGPEQLGNPDAANFAGATTPSGPSLSFPDGGTSGTLTLPDGREVQAYAFPDGGIQPRIGPGSEAVQVNYAGQDVTAYIRGDKAYIKNFNPQEFSNPVQESWLPAVRLLKLPADKLIDQKSTVMSWALSESVGRRSTSFNLTTVGTYTVFENVDRYRKAIMELKGVPGSTRPEYYRPDMMDAPTKPDKKPGLIGRGLNALDRGVKKVGGALSNFGHQFTTNVTKEKLKMNWHQAGKPSDSDQLAAWLAKQGVPQEVVTSVYGKMGIPYTPQATPAQAAEPQATTAGGAQRSMPFYGTNPATKKPWTYDELQAKSQAGTTPAPAPAPAATTAATTAKTATTAQPGFNAANVMKLPGMEKYAKAPAPVKPASFASGPTGYGKTTMSVKPMAGIPGMKAPTAPTAPKAPGSNFSVNLPAGGGAGVKAAAQPEQLSKDEYIKRIGAPAMPESRVFNALKKPVAEMLQMVETKEDVARIKQFVDQTFVKYGTVTESSVAIRNRLIEHVTQVGAQRRREFARKG
jgi:LysM repeat protein